MALRPPADATRDLATLYSPSHPVEVSRRGARAGTVGWEEADSGPDTDFELLYGLAKDEGLGMQLLTYNDGDPEGGYFLLLAAPPEGGRIRELPKDVVFILDTSGSMAEGEKLAQATRALGFCLKNLAAADRFQVVRFSTDVEPLFDGLARADAAHLERAREFLAGLRPRGGTAIEEVRRDPRALRSISGSTGRASAGR